MKAGICESGAFISYDGKKHDCLLDIVINLEGILEEQIYQIALESIEKYIGYKQ